MQPDNDLNLLRAHWADEAVPAGLAERIIRHARSQAQWQPWWARLTVAVGDWRSAWGYKGAALAAVAALGLLGGQFTSYNASADPLAAGGASWTEGSY